jgi:dienelactone hydrolase
MRAALVGLLVLVLAPAAAEAAGPTFPTGDCPYYGEQQVCTAEVPSFDGAPLDVDLTLPREGTGPRHPLIVLLHGFGNDKHEWQWLDDAGDDGDKWRWNSHWFSRRGFYVLTATARGFDSDDVEDATKQPATPSGTSFSAPNGTIQLKSREVEIRDTQWLAALVANTFPDVDRDRVAVSGNSYGGGESWLQAADPEWAFAGLPALRLRVAVPKYGWTDLGYGLAPSGHPGGYDSATTPGPIGDVKLTYVNGFFALGGTHFELGARTTPNTEGPINIHAWKSRLGDVGDPYDAAGAEDPVVAQARRGLTEYRGAYYQRERFEAQAAAGDEVAVFSIQGWTDDLFTSVESFRQYRQLKSIDPRWPVAVALADVGHSRARNPERTWQRLNGMANAFLDAHLDGSGGGASGIVSERGTCGDDAGELVAARTPERLANDTFTATLAAGTLPPGSGVGDPDGIATDPIVGPQAVPGECRSSAAAAFPGRYTDRTRPLPEPRTYVGIGEVVLRYALASPTTTTVAARVWDESPDGSAVLVDRGVYRIDPPAYDRQAGTLRLPLYGNHWRFERGHRIRVDLMQADTPSLRPPTVPNAVTFGPPRLVLPVR